METIQGIYPACSVKYNKPAAGGKSCRQHSFLWDYYSYTEKKIIHMGEK